MRWWRHVIVHAGSACCPQEKRRQELQEARDQRAIEEAKRQRQKERVRGRDRLGAAGWAQWGVQEGRAASRVGLAGWVRCHPCELGPGVPRWRAGDAGACLLAQEQRRREKERKKADKEREKRAKEEAKREKERAEVRAQGDRARAVRGGLLAAALRSLLLTTRAVYARCARAEVGAAAGRVGGAARRRPRRPQWQGRRRCA